jgi:hypothetical protein
MTAFALVSVCLLAGELEYYDNLVQNPSFEQDRDRDTYPDGWRPYAFDSPARLDWDPSVARIGSRSLSIRDSFRPQSQIGTLRLTEKPSLLRVSL